MEVEVSKENICINKLVSQKKEIIFVNTDMIVPDSKPDVLNTINVTGNVCIYKKEVMEEKVKIDGNVNTYIMYLPDSKDDNIRALNCNIEFSESIPMKMVKEGMIVCVKPCIKDIECKVLNGRKISVKAGIEFDIKVYSNEDVQVISTVNNIDNFQSLEENFNVNSLIGNGRTPVYAKDTINVDLKDEIAEILKVDVSLVDKDVKISYNKVLAKAEAEVKVMYLTEDNRIGKVQARIPVVGFIDLQNISENNICDLNYIIKNMVIRPNSAEEHSIYIELEIEVECMAYERKDIRLIQDLYSPTANLEFTQKTISTSSGINDNTKEFTIKDTVQIPGLDEGNLIDVGISYNLANTKITSSKIVYSGDIGLNFIYSNASTITSNSAKIPFEVEVNNDEKTENINVETDINIKSSSFNVKPSGEVEAEITMEINTKTNRNTSMNIIDNIKLAEDEGKDEDYDSLILYITHSGDTLWKIAKRFNSTVDELKRINGIEDENKLDVGQKIYIPKFNYVRNEIKTDAK